MSWPVNIPFRKRLEVGETTFKLNVPRKFLQQSDRTFGFQTITLLPEYQSKQAYVYNMDPQSELKQEVKNSFYLEVTYDSQYYKATTWSFAQPITGMGSLLQQLNNHFDSKKPPGSLFPPVVFDWISVIGLDTPDDLREYYVENAKDFYNEPYNEQKHGNALPPSLASRYELNNLIYPTTNNPEVLDLIRIRMFLAPNVTVTFSNESLPKTLGFSDEQIPARNTRNQVAFANTNASSFEEFVCLDEPKKVSATELKTARVNVYATNDFVYSPLGELKTTRGRERKCEQLADDYQQNISSLARKMNLYMSLIFDRAMKKFSIVYPNNFNVHIDIKTKPHVCKQLGFEPLDVIKYRATADAIPDDSNVHEIEQKARALVYDTGMVVVDLNQQVSQQNSYSGTATMATLEPVYDGVMRNLPGVEMPRVMVTYFDPVLEFVLYRIGDDDQPHSLEWSVGAFVQGLLVGKV